MPHPITAATPKKPLRACPECGAGMAGRHPTARFCRPKCRDDFNNRESERGAILYRMKMAERFERTDPKARRLISVMNRLCAQWRDEDTDRRAGRRSWGDWKEWLALNPWVISPNRPVQDGIVFSSGTALKRR